MQRYFLELSYKGTRYSGFQIQGNAVTIQFEVQKAFRTFYRHDILLTGSSRTDTGVHARQNFFHFDTEVQPRQQDIYHLNSILPPDIVIKNIFIVPGDAHCRFHARSREYRYYIYDKKDPFLEDRAWYFPYPVEVDLLQEGAELIKRYTDFSSFSKRNTQVKTFQCQIIKCHWVKEHDCLVFNVEANRFLRGMVRGLTATMIQMARKKITATEFCGIIEAKDCTKADFSAPAHGLFLTKVNYDFILTAVD